MAELKSIQDLANEWISLDQNPDTSNEIKSLVAANNIAELEKCLRNRIQFGTAGLRSKLQAGFSRMNELTVLQASQGLATYVERTVTNAKERGIVIGHDHRHNSLAFAQLTACAFITKGFKVYYYDKLVHTPLVPFGVEILSAACGVMITASHNPAPDNGYKVYWDNGCQIISPHDKGISKAIDENLVPWVWNKDLVNSSSLVERPLKQIEDAYFTVLAKLAGGKHIDPALKFVYTPMHGVGLPYALKATALVGASPGVNFFNFPEQSEPDPDFPTVKFPNPEEHGALDLPIKFADEHLISIVLASDPDADRFNAAVKGKNGKWVQLNGNEIGILFAYYIYQSKKDKNLAMLNSTASSRILSAFAEVEGFYYEETLTGFKWIGNRALELEKKGYVVPFAFEEAIGYMFEGLHDKDGISATLVFLKLVDWASSIFKDVPPAEGVLQLLNEIYLKYGYFESNNSYYVSLDPAVTERVFAGIRSIKNSEEGLYQYPETVGARKVTYWRDLTIGYDSSTPDHVPLLPVSKSSQMITCSLDDNVRITIRGSGTEPKLKVYIEAKSNSTDSAKAIARAVWHDLEKEWFKPDETGLLKA
ncbi:hypothetical protein V1514DRAFT_325575 [Lipomyces japonicus]|uniref:uncharacterized protein n=1 Tax=Lipomyces japonicus TaxID=56871 RepID=UPI0034CF718C